MLSLIPPIVCVLKCRLRFASVKHARIQKVLSEGVQLRQRFNFYFIFIFILIKGGRIQIPLLAGHQRSASETPFKWRFTGGLMMAQLMVH